MSIGLLTRGFIPERTVDTVTTSDALVYMGMTVQESALTLSFNSQPSVANPTLSSWVIRALDGCAGPPVKSLLVMGSTLIVNTGEHRPDTRYTLTIPPGGLGTPTGGPYVGISTIEYLGLGFPPSIESVYSEDETHILVTYSEALQEAGMLTLPNYEVTPRLRLDGIEWVSDRSIRLTTGRQVPGVMYQLVVYNLKDLAGNSLTLSSQ